MDLAQQLAQLREIRSVVKWRDNHDSVGASLRGVFGEVDTSTGREVSCPGDDGDSAGGGLDTELSEGLALLRRESDELAGAASGDQTMDTGRD